MIQESEITLDVVREALTIHGLMGHGGLLLWIHDRPEHGCRCQLLARPDYIRHDPTLRSLQRGCSIECAELLLKTGLFHKLTEHGEPPPDQRKKHDGYRMGWREMGFMPDQMESASLYCFLQ